MRKAILVLLLAAVAAACGRNGGPAPVRYGDASPPPEKPASKVAGETTNAPDRAVHVVERGDTAYSLARRYRVPLRTFIEVNGLEPPYLLRVGQRLVVPQARRHVVKRGDTVYGISRRYGVDMSALTRLNGIGPPYTIKPGQVLRLPRPGETRVAEAPKPDRPESARQSLADDGRPARSEQEARPAPKADTSAVRKASAQVRPDNIPQPPPRAGGKFLWPLRGRIVSGFGPQNNGLHNDGVNIAAPRGATVRAADNGVVAYAGNELRGFGKLLLVKHAGGWVTAYAHNDELLVSRGQQVRRGQPIARVGTSGSVSRPQLHFEIRRGIRAVDPFGMLGPQAAALGSGTG